MIKYSKSNTNKLSNQLHDKIERMKALALSNHYICNGELYKLLDSEYIIPLLKKLNDGEVEISSDIVYGRKIITIEEKFLDNLDKYISYVRNHYYIDHIELNLLLELTLSNKYSKILFDLKDFHSEENYNMYFEEFRKMFNYNLYNNIYYYSKFADKHSAINKFILEIKDYDYDNKKDIKQVEKVFIEMLNIRKNNIYNALVPYKEVKDRNYDFYVVQVEWLISDYYKGRSLKLFKLEDNDNYIEVGTNTKLLFNICDRLSKLKDDDYINIEFGIQNNHFNCKDKGQFIAKKELFEIMEYMKNFKAEFGKEKMFDLIDSTLCFKFYGDKTYRYLDISFKNNVINSYIVVLENDEICELYNLINKQLKY